MAYQLSWLSNALTVLFSITAVLLLAGVVTHPASPAPGSSSAGIHVLASGATAALVVLLMLSTVVLFLVWFYRARKNAALTGWPQRRSPAMAVVSWFLPPVFLWFPYQVMADIWRAGQSPDQRRGSANAALPALWWASWTLAWLTSYQHSSSTTRSGGGGQSVTITSSNHTLNFGGTVPSALFAAAAAVTLVVIIRRVSAGQVGHPATQAEAPAGA